MGFTRLSSLSIAIVVCSLIIFITPAARAQSLGNAGTIEGSVTDQSGASVPGAMVLLRNAVSGYSQSATTATDGSFRLTNIPPNPYHLQITASGFTTSEQDVTVRNAIPVQVKEAGCIGGVSSVTVEAAGADILENNPSAHIDVDRSLILKLPSSDPGGGLSQAITYSTGGVAADGNGLFHPLGDHAQASFVIDGQPISDQQSKVFSTQLPTSAIQSMEVTTGTPDAEFGDKSSLVAQITTRSGLGAGKVFGNIGANYGSFGTAGGSMGWGSAREVRNFLAAGWRTQRPLPGYSGVHAVPRHRQQPNDFRSLRLSAQRQGRHPSQPVHGAELDSDSQHLRPVEPGSAPARAHLEHRARLSAHLQRSHSVDDQSLHPQRPIQLLPQPRSFRRHARPRRARTASC